MSDEQGAPQGGTQGRWDPVLRELNALRVVAGEPSYAEIARRLVEQRVAAGQSEHAARIARSSVHDAFRLGRARINVALVRELVQVLGADPERVDEWLTRVEGASVTVPAAQPAPAAAPVAPVVPAPEPPLPSRGQVAGLALACLALNLLGRQFVDFFSFPIYLDMVGTAVAAIALGPWRGAAVGLATNVVGAIGSGWLSLPFALVNVVGALVWGYGVRRWGMGRTLARFFVLNLGVALACSAVAVPILLILVGDRLRGGHDMITDLVEEAVGSFTIALSFSNVLTSSADKLLSGFVALVVVSALPYAMRARPPLILANGPPTPRPGA